MQVPAQPLVQGTQPALRLADVALGVVLGALIATEIVVTDIPGHRWLLLATAVAQGAAIVWRRRRPRATAITSAIALTAPNYAGTPTNEGSTLAIVALVIAMYALGRYALDQPRDRRSTYAAWALTFLIASAASVYQHGIAGSDVVFIGLFAIPPTVLGRAISASEAARRRAEQMNAKLVEQGAQLRDQAARDERERIARELHDVIAHSVSLMGLQAGAARKVLAAPNPEIERSLRSIEETGRDTLNELRRMLGVMRHPGEPEALAPQPGLSALATAVDRQRRSGATVDCSTGEGLEGLSPGVDLAAFRIVQEALTNSARHAPLSPVSITAAVDAGVIRLTVISRGAELSPEPGTECGHGIIGMKERAELYGGKVSAEFERGIGFVVRATLLAEYLVASELRSAR